MYNLQKGPVHVVQPNKTFPDSHIIETKIQQLPKEPAVCLMKLWNERFGTLRLSKGYFPLVITFFFFERETAHLCTWGKRGRANLKQAPQWAWSHTQSSSRLLVSYCSYFLPEWFYFLPWFSQHQGPQFHVITCVVHCTEGSSSHPQSRGKFKSFTVSFTFPVACSCLFVHVSGSYLGLITSFNLLGFTSLGVPIHFAPLLTILISSLWLHALILVSEFCFSFGMGLPGPFPVFSLPPLCLPPHFTLFLLLAFLSPTFSLLPPPLKAYIQN